MSWWQRRLCVWFSLLSVVVAFGCGGEEECVEGECVSGVCDAGSGSCANPEECDADQQCLAGYECGEDRRCEPSERCEEDGDCDVGRCDGGVCVNPESCDADSACLERTFCGPSGTCERDPCNDVHCQRGVCRRGTDRCVSADSCSRSTELDDCVRGERCVDGACVEEEHYCEALGCERGECSFEAGGCVNPDECDADSECLEDYFCDDSNRCERDRCEGLEVECADGGVCEAASGRCVNPESCDGDSVCLSGYYCVDSECRPEESACGGQDGDGGCPGNQVCQIEEGSAQCREPERCDTSVDCHADRQCSGRTCIDQIRCVDDAFEPNDDASQATDWHEAAGDSSLRAVVCPDDRDVFAFDTGEMLGEYTRGALVVDVEVPERDRGLGEVEVTLSDRLGDEEAKTTGGSGTDGRVRFDRPISAADRGEFQLEVSAGSDVEAAGVGYRAAITVLGEGETGVCEDVRRVEANQRISDTSDAFESARLRSSCGRDHDDLVETVYAYRADAPQRVSFTLSPHIGGQFIEAYQSLSLRERCLQNGSEIACSETSEEGGEETLTAHVEPGLYYLLVQATSRWDQELLVESEPAACGLGSDHCESEETSSVCVAGGDGFDRRACDEGCVPSTGRCTSAE